MALKGHNRQGYCLITETTAADGTVTETLAKGKVTKHVISFGGKKTQAETDLYAGDEIEESELGAITGDVDINLSQLPITDKAEITGREYSVEKGMIEKVGDKSPFVRYGAIGVGVRNGKDFFVVNVYYKVKFSTPDDSFKTKQTNVEFKLPELKGKIFANCNGDVKFENEFDTFDAALAKFQELLNVTTDPKT